MYKITVDSETTVKKFGEWNRDHGLKVSNPEIWVRRDSMEGYHLRYKDVFLFLLKSKRSILKIVWCLTWYKLLHA